MNQKVPTRWLVGKRVALFSEPDELDLSQQQLTSLVTQGLDGLIRKMWIREIFICSVVRMARPDRSLMFRTGQYIQALSHLPEPCLLGGARRRVPSTSPGSLFRMQYLRSTQTYWIITCILPRSPGDLCARQFTPENMCSLRISVTSQIYVCLLQPPPVLCIQRDQYMYVEIINIIYLDSSCSPLLLEKRW